VGSFLRPKTVVDARAHRAEGEIGPEELREVEDEAIAEVVRQQEEVGLKGITDGEFRRFFFHTDFLEQLDGVTVTEGNFLAKFHRTDGSEIEFSPPTMGVDGPIHHSHPIQGPDFDYLASQVTRTPKVSIPAPSMLHFRGGRQGISEEVYPDLEQFFDDLTAAYRDEIADLAARGARYVQMDDTNLAYLCDPEVRERTAARGDDPDDLTRLYCRLVNDSFRDRPDDMVAAVHLCRGNFQSAWVTQGGYEPVAEILLNDMAVDAFFLEYDDERSGDFAPLRFLPPGKMVVLGLMSSKHGDVESADEIKARIDEAAVYAPLEQLALSHQCGFSSTVHGNQLSPDDQWRKLARTIEVAHDVWGYS
jgi:5-methyltetrahydropteroyltriglutamate--homocysteine methyltransferase